MIEENKAIVRRYIDALNDQDLDALEELSVPDLARKAKGELIP